MVECSCKAKDIKKAEYYKSILVTKAKPTAYIMNQMISLYMEKGDIQKAKGILNEMKSRQMNTTVAEELLKDDVVSNEDDDHL